MLYNLCKVPQGLAGVTGASEIQYIPGTQGATGATQSPGVTGPQLSLIIIWSYTSLSLLQLKLDNAILILIPSNVAGVKGEVGPTGNTGPKGDQGDTGKGDTGIAGKTNHGSSRHFTEQLHIMLHVHKYL